MKILHRITYPFIATHAALALVIGALPASVLSANLERGRILSESEHCQGCHSETGDSDTPTIPNWPASTRTTC